MLAHALGTIRLPGGLVAAAAAVASAIIGLITGKIVVVNDLALFDDVIIIEIVHVYDIVFVYNVMLVFNDMLMPHDSLVFIAVEHLLADWCLITISTVIIVIIITHIFPPLWVSLKMGGKLSG